MPITKENKKLYPKNWDEISLDIRENRAGNQCENCGATNHAVGFWLGNTFMPLALPPYQVSGMKASGMKGATQYKKATVIRDYYNTQPGAKESRALVIVLTVAHLDHDPTNNDPENLKALCQRCHNRYDRSHRDQTIRKRKLKGQTTLIFTK